MDKSSVNILINISFFIPQKKKKNKGHILADLVVSPAELQQVTPYTIRLSRNAESNEKSPLRFAVLLGECSRGDLSLLQEQLM